MPFTVITLKKVPDSLRGDLTRWMQEIATGVYVGNFNSRVREYLWKRVTNSIGNGEATMCYSYRNEIGYSFYTYNTERQVIDYEGIPLVLIPAKDLLGENLKAQKTGFSNASRYHLAKHKLWPKSVAVSQKTKSDGSFATFAIPEKRKNPDMVFLDIETTGLNVDDDQIIEIGAIKVSDDKVIEFHRLVRANNQIPDVVCKMTGITEDMLRAGTMLEKSIRDLAVFIQGTVLAGYNIAFDIAFLNRALERFSLEPIHNKTVELLREAKKRNSFQENYKFETTLKEYGINQGVPHRALEDAKLMYQLYIQMGIG